MHTNNRRGIALAVALVAIVVIGTLIAGVFFSANQEYRIGRNSLVQERALGVAERGQVQVLNDWSLDWNADMKKGDVMTFARTYAGGDAATVRLTRLNQLTFWVTSEGRTAANATQANRHTGMLLRLEIPQARMNGAITSSRTTHFRGNAGASGDDVNPTGWTECDPAGTAKAGVVNDALGDVTGAGANCGSGTTLSCVSGSPKVAVDSLAGHDSTYLSYGPFTFDELVAMANIVWNIAGTVVINQIQPSVTGTTCNRGQAQPRNWGDVTRPGGPCATYFPIIHLRGLGLADVQGGSGQGILLVDGNIHLRGGFEWYGPIIVKGNVLTSGNGNKVTGGIMAMNQGCTTAQCNDLSGTSSVLYSRCALNQALSMHVRPVASTRSWADMF